MIVQSFHTLSILLLILLILFVLNHFNLFSKLNPIFLSKILIATSGGLERGGRATSEAPPWSGGLITSRKYARVMATCGFLSPRNDFQYQDWLPEATQNSATRETSPGTERSSAEGDCEKVEYASLPRWDSQLRFIVFFFLINIYNYALLSSSSSSVS